ncbi:substrate-binding domain-containing protein [Paenibacillaceae bacterium WGS1546]|uniref:substrate-binding domain-containing protein n=1 Tax=Cohnella sp. WGS1546 TaxID=3366810 RepID=UPI00372D0774
MKKTVMALVAMLVIMSLAACSGGNKNEGGTGSTAATPSSDKGEKKIVIGFSQGTMNHPFRVAMVEQNVKYAQENYKDVEVITTDGENTASKQVSDVESLISRKVDVLVISPLTEDALTPVVKKAMDAGIPVITLDRKVNTEVTLHIGGNNLALGKTAGEYITNAIGGKGNVIEIQGTAGASATVERNQGFRETLGKDVKIIAEQHADYLREPALKFMEDMLQRYGKGEIQAVYAHNDEMALGAIQALKAANRLDEVKVIGVDGENLAIDSVSQGELLATLTYPFCAPEGIQYAYKIAKGETFPKEIELESKIIDASNVAENIGKGF